MSSNICSISLKRSHSSSFRDSSDSEDEASPPIKLKCNSFGTKIPVYIRSHLENLLLWVSDLSVKDCFKMAVKAGASLPDETIVIDDDDDDDIQVIDVKEAAKPVELVNPFLERLKAQREHPRRRLECAIPRSNRSLVNGNSYYNSSKSVNGSTYKNWGSRGAENGNYNLRQLRTSNLKRPAVISKPETDVEILLEEKAQEMLAAETDEIKILSESPNMKKKPGNFGQCPTRASPRPTAKKSFTPDVSHSQKFVSQTQKPSTSKSQSSNGPFTAHEVFRLHERIQYQLLLDKYISGSHYQPASKPQSDAEVQANVENSEMPGAHFKKEVLQQPVENFIEKYCKPCQLVSPVTYQDAQEKKCEPGKKCEPQEVKIDDDDDDEIKILEVKLPKYVPVYKEKPDFFSTEWIDELKRTVNAQSEERLLIVKEHERMLEKYRKERYLDLLKVEVPVPEAQEPEFPELTPEMEEAIDKALHTGSPNDRICKITSDYLMRKDIDTLNGLNWLNDLVINSYFDLIMARSKLDNFASVHAYNTFFYSTYKSKGYASVRRWTRKLDIFSFDLNFVPIHLGVHWCLGVIDHRSKRICYYDSMGQCEDQCLNLLHEYLILEYKDKKGKVLDPNAYTTEVMKDIPQQLNGSDCGMFTLKYAEYISRDMEITFSQKHMQYFRRRMVYELLTAQLL